MDTEAVPTPVRILGLEGCSSRKRRAAYRCAAFATRLHTTAVDAKRSLRIAAVDVAIAGVSGPLKAYNADARRSNPADLRYRHPLAANPSSALNLTNTKPRLRPLHLVSAAGKTLLANVPDDEMYRLLELASPEQSGEVRQFL